MCLPSRDIEALGINGGCKIHGPAVLADDLGVGLNGNVGSPGRGTTDNGSTQYCPEVMKAFEGVKFIAEHTRREEESFIIHEREAVPPGVVLSAVWAYDLPVIK